MLYPLSYPVLTVLGSYLSQIFGFEVMRDNRVWPKKKVKGAGSFSKLMCPRQLIDLDITNFEYQIGICLLLVFCRQMKWEKIKINIQNSTYQNR